MKVWFSDVSKGDARLLIKWWNANAPAGVWFFRRPLVWKRGRYEVVRQGP